MKYIFKLAVYSVFVLTFSIFINAQTTDDNAKLLAIISENNITGVWHLNYEESDNTITKLESLIKKTTPSNLDNNETKSETSNIPTVSVSLNPPESLVLYGDGNKTITINEGFANVVVTRTIATDGTMKPYEVEMGVTSFVTATQTNELLKIEMVSPRGNKMQEIYSTVDAGKKLVVTLRFEDINSKEIFLLRRVYDRTLIDPFIIGSEEM